MGEMMGSIIGLGFFLFFILLVCSVGVFEFLNVRRQQKFAHEQEMARLMARKRPNRAVRETLSEDMEEKE